MPGSASIARLAGWCLLLLATVPLLAVSAMPTSSQQPDHAPFSSASASDSAPIYDAGPIKPRLAPPASVAAARQAQVAAAPTVSKSVSPTVASPGTTVTYTLTISSQDTLSHTVVLTDVLPTGVSYVPGSLSGTGASYDAGENRIIVSASLTPTRSANYSYEDDLMVTGLAASSPLGGYIDFSAPPYNFTVQPRADDSAFNFNFGCPFEFYGATSGTANFLGYSTNGLFFPRGIPADAATPLETALPAPTAPNGLIAGLWDSMSLTNTNTFTSTGRLPVTFNTGCDQKVTVLQLKDLHTRSDSDPTRNALDVELVYNHGQPEHYWLLYNNVRGPLNSGTIGLENQSGTLGLTYLSDGQPATRMLTSGRVIHYFRPLLPPAPLTISFQATVDADAPASVTNVASYSVDGGQPQSVSAILTNPDAPTATPTATPTETPTSTPTSTSTSTSTSTPTDTATATATLTSTSTGTPTGTPTSTATATATPTATATETPTSLRAFLPLVFGPGIPPRPLQRAP